MFTSYTFLLRSAHYYSAPLNFSLHDWTASSLVFHRLLANVVLSFSSSTAPASELPVYIPQPSLSIFFAVYAQLTENPVSLTVGKPISSPLSAFFLIPSHYNISSTVITILHSLLARSLAKREASVYQRTHTNTHRA